MSSKLSRSIEAYITNRHRRQPVEMRLIDFDFESSVPEDLTCQMQTLYRFEARLGMRAYVESSKSEAVEHTLESIKRGVIEEVYGDIRRLLIELRIELLHSDVSYNLHGSKVNDVLHKLFEETEV